MCESGQLTVDQVAEVAEHQRGSEHSTVVTRSLCQTATTADAEAVTMCVRSVGGASRTIAGGVVMTTIDLHSTSQVDAISNGLSAYVARPTKTSGPWPGVVVIHELFGIDDVMRRQVERLAEAGYLAIMPDLFSQGGRRRCIKGTFAALKTGEGRAFRDIEAARRWLTDQSDCTGRIGVIGCCMGGAFALLAAVGRGFEVSSVNYGGVPPEPDEALAGACPVVASYGRRDRAFKGKAQRLAEALDRHGSAYDIKEYPNAGHCFLNDAPVGPIWLRPVMKVFHI